MTTHTQIIVGAGAEVVRLAAALVHKDLPVQVCRTAPSLPDTLACRERRGWRASRSGSSEAVLGPLRPAAEAKVGVVARDAIHPLPLQPWQVSGLLQPGERRTAARSWLRARARNGLAVVVGGGQEERTYIDWVVRRMGRSAYDALYADYAVRRWGRSGAELSASVARATHGALEAGPLVEPVDHGAARALELIARAGVEVVDAPDARLVVSGGRVTGVEGGGGLRWTGNVWTTLTPDQVGIRLGEDCPSAARHLAAGLASEPAWRVRLSGARAEGPDELHVLDPAPCWRYVRAPDDADCWMVSVTGGAPSVALAEDIRDHARQLGLVSDSAKVVDMGGLPGGVPTWGPSDNARLRTILEVWQKLGIRATGRGGTYAELDPTEVLAHVDTLCKEGEPDLLDAWRVHVAPTAREEDLDARITRFFAAS